MQIYLSIRDMHSRTPSQLQACYCMSQSQSKFMRMYALVCVYLSTLMAVDSHPVVWDMPPLRNVSFSLAMQQLLEQTRAANASTHRNLSDYLLTVSFNGTETLPLPDVYHLSTYAASTVSAISAANSLSTERYLSDFLATSHCEDEEETVHTSTEAYSATHATTSYSPPIPGVRGSSMVASDKQDSTEDLSAAVVLLLQSPAFAVVFCLLLLGQ